MQRGATAMVVVSQAGATASRGAHRRCSGGGWRRIAVLVSAAALGMAGWSFAAFADQHGLHTNERLKKDHHGYALYQQYCASCHGVWADGEGVLKPVLVAKPTNLRTLARRQGAPLDRERLAEVIDGRKPIVAHGSREMPVWGKRLGEGVYTPVPDMRKRSMVMVIVDYLEAIQEKP